MTLGRYVSTEMECRSYHLGSHATNDNGVRFSDGRCSGTHRVDKGVFYVWTPGPLLSHLCQKRKRCFRTVVVFASVVESIDREELD